MPASQRTRARIRASHPERGAQHRELYFFTLYRVFQASLIAFLAYSPFAGDWVRVLAPLPAQAGALSYLLCALLLLLAGRYPHWPIERQVIIGTAIDVAATLAAKACMVGVDSGLALLLLVNIGAAALLLPLRWSLGYAGAAALATVIEFVLSSGSSAPLGGLAEASMFGVTYLSAAVLCHFLGRQLRETAALAQRRGEEVANLAQINELIIRRMRSGVIVVDTHYRISLINEAAWHLLGEPNPSERRLDRLNPALSERLSRWRHGEEGDDSPMTPAPDRAEVIPRFARLGTADELFVVFLDDSALVSRRAEQLTLSTLGRLSASIAHEIRNPLGAISHATQLLQESEAIADTDRRLLDIVLNHCQRMNGIVENVLALSRRERSRPEQLDLTGWTLRLVNDYRRGHFVPPEQLRAAVPRRPLLAIADPQQLQQVVTTLIDNALAYGHLAGEPPRVSVVARAGEVAGTPMIEVIDHGPGIPDSVVPRVFEPFYTTHEFGSGLGLYIAREMCEANQAILDYVPVAAGGSCFRITLQSPSLLGAANTAPTVDRAWRGGHEPA